MAAYQVKSPVLLLAFNRPDLAQQVFDQIRAVRPSRLYMAVDGARQGNAQDHALCEQTRAIVKQVDWDCSVHTLFPDTNKGCKLAVSGAITWFFQQEEEGIILEDDCLPVEDFFRFCDVILEKYRNDSRIKLATGTNLQRGRQWGHASYYFSQYSNIWGWACWQRVWQGYDVNLARYSEEEAAIQLPKVFADPFLAADWLRIFKDLKAGKIDTWDYQFNFITFFDNGLCATPNVNLISNIGFRPDATHTPDPLNHNARLPTGTLNEIIHPVCFLPEKEADYFFLRKEFDLDIRWKRHNKLKRRFKRWITGLFR